MSIALLNKFMESNSNEPFIMNVNVLGLYDNSNCEYLNEKTMTIESDINNIKAYLKHKGFKIVKKIEFSYVASIEGCTRYEIYEARKYIPIC